MSATSSSLSQHAYSCFSVEIADHIAHLRLNRPEKMNSMTRAFWQELPQAINDISDNALARVIVISSEGKHFSSGMDISVFMDGEVNKDAPHFLHKVRALQDSFTALEKARMPVLCAIQGGAIGGAVDLVTAADCRYATKDAFFCIQETAIGMTADVGTFPRLAKLMPEGWVRQMAYTAERLDANKAKALGLVNEVFETSEEMRTAVMEIAKQITRNAPLAVTGCKAMINYARDHSTTGALDYVGVWNAGMLSGETIQESYNAKSENRAPAYADLKPFKKAL